MSRTVLDPFRITKQCIYMGDRILSFTFAIYSYLSHLSLLPLSHKFLLLSDFLSSPRAIQGPYSPNPIVHVLLHSLSSSSSSFAFSGSQGTLISLNMTRLTLPQNSLCSSLQSLNPVFPLPMTLKLTIVHWSTHHGTTYLTHNLSPNFVQSRKLQLHGPLQTTHLDTKKQSYPDYESATLVSLAPIFYLVSTFHPHASTVIQRK